MRHVISVLLFCAGIQPVCAQTLKEAIQKKDTILALSLIKKGADPNARDEYGTTLLMGACRFPDVAIASFLLRNGARPDEPRSDKGRTALMVACAYWSGMDIVKLLIARGADLNAAAQDGATPLMLAASNEKQDVVDYLLSKGANAKAKDAKGQTALDYARKGKVEDYMITSVKDTRFDKAAVVESLEAAMKK